MKGNMKKLNKKQTEKFAKNALKFTAPALVIFFAQLSQGVEPKLAGGVALLALYGLVADYLGKMNK